MLKDTLFALARIISEMLILKKISDDKVAKDLEKEDELKGLVIRNVWRSGAFATVTSFLMGEISKFGQSSYRLAKSAERIKRDNELIVTTLGQDVIKGDFLSVINHVFSFGEFRGKAVVFGGSLCFVLVLGEYLGLFLLKTIKHMFQKGLKGLSEQRAIDAVIIDEARLIAKAKKLDEEEEALMDYDSISNFNRLSRTEFANLAKSKAAKQYDEYQNNLRRKRIRYKANNNKGD